MKLNTILWIIAILAIGLLSATTFTFKNQVKSLQTDKENLQSDLTDLKSTYLQLADAFDTLRKQKTYSISLSPTIDTKISSVLGSSKQLTFRYYFTMDGNTCLLYASDAGDD
jgi:uncharacterized protein YpmB